MVQFCFSRRTSRRGALALIACAVAVNAVPVAAADGKLTIGVVLPLSGTYANEGQQYENGIKVFQSLHGTAVAGLTVQVVTRDDQGPGSGDLSRRLTQELILRDKADVILGYSFTPNAMSTASLLTEAQKPAVIINAATSIITEKSPYFVRVSFTTPQVSYVLGEWAAQHGIKTVYTIVSDYAPGLDAEAWFKNAFTKGGGTIIGSARTPVSEMEYAPFLQGAMEAKPDAIFSFDPGGDVAVAFMKEAKKRGVTDSGIKLLVTGDLVEDNSLPLFGDALKGVISAHHYQIGLDNAANIAFVKKYKELFGQSAIPNFRAVQGYDGMALIYQAVAATKGDLGSAALMKALKGATLDSPRGKLTIDPNTRDIVQTIYIRQGRQVDGQWQNVQIEAYPEVKDPAKDPAKNAAAAPK
jgi:branched-chain amino acid transport system substrate-binding protein